MALRLTRGSGLGGDSSVGVRRTADAGALPALVPAGH
jgi:hypothetical protein